MKQLLVGKDLNYGSSKASATKNTATNPDFLANGAIGIYGIASNAANDNSGKLALISDAAAAGVILDEAYSGPSIWIAQGTPTGAIVSNKINVADIRGIVGKPYSAPVLQVSYVGFNPVTNTGSLNLLPFLDRAEGILGVTDVTLNSQQFPKENFSTSRIFADSNVFDVLASVLQKNRERNPASRVIVGLVSNGTPTNFANTASVVNGSRAVTSTAHGRSVGDLIRVSGEVYKVAEVVDANTFILDRPYHGETNPALAVTAIQSLASVTEYGFKLTATRPGQYFETSADGIFDRATQSPGVGASTGSGSGPQVVALEKNRQAYAGNHDKIDARMKQPPVYADETLNYTLHFINAVNKEKNRAEMGILNAVDIEVAIAFPETMANSGRTIFEQVLVELFPQAVTL